MMKDIMILQHDFIIYKNKDSHQIGLVKSIDCERNTAKVWYHTGGTAACTPFDMIVYASPIIEPVLFWFNKEKVLITNYLALPSLILRRYALTSDKLFKLGDFIDTNDLIDIV